MRQPLILPKPLRAGDVVRVIAPSGHFDRTLFWRGVGWLGRHFRVRFERRLFERESWCAGTSARRLAELNAALRCPDARAIWCARGGYGAGELAAVADFGALASFPKWLVGFSDVTALHLELNQRGIASLHASNVTGLGVGWDALREQTLQGACGRGDSNFFTNLRRIYPGDAEGPLVGGNLTLVHDAVCAGRFRPPPGAFLFLEEVNEAPYRVARLLSGLERAGTFDELGAVVFGQLSSREVGVERAYLPVLNALAERIRLPMAADLPVGHHPQVNSPLVLGALARLQGSSLRSSA